MSASLVAAVVIPGSPMMLPDYVGLADPFAEIRSRTVDLVARVVNSGVDEVVVLAGAEATPRHTKGSLGVRVGRRLLNLAGWDGRVSEVTVDFAATGEALRSAALAVRAGSGRVLVLVVADGSATRTEKAPGFLDSRAAAVDASVVAALSSGSPDALLALDPQLCEELWLTGRAALQVLAVAVAGCSITSESVWSDDPHGVLYLLAHWRLSEGDAPLS